MDVWTEPLRALRRGVLELIQRAFVTDVDDEFVDDPLLSLARTESKWSTS